MKKLAIIAAAFVLLILAFAIVPVFAESPKKIPVTVTRINPTFGIGDSWTTDDNTFHVRDTTASYQTYRIIGDGINLEGPTFATGAGNLNLDDHKGHLMYDSQLLF